MGRRGMLALCVAVASVAAFAAPALADVTITGRFVLVSGDTIERNSYYSGARMRVTGPDGTEFLYEKKTQTVTIVDHARRVIHTAPRARADSIAGGILLESRRQIAQTVGPESEAWEQRVRAFNDSVVVTKTEERRKIAGYPTQKWELKVHPYVNHERWIARGMEVTDYAPEMEKIALAWIPDPGNRLLMKLLLGMRTASGVALSSRTTFRTPTQSGLFSFEASKVATGSIADSAFALPADYEVKRH